MTAMAPLATFVDRTTMVYERAYPHPIERVWDAVTTAEQLDAWMVPTCLVERRLGGACSFTWGGTEPEPGVVTVWEPPRAVRYSFDDGSWLTFDLETTSDGGTSLRFTLHYDELHPELLAGFHEMLDDLGGVLAGTWTREDNVRWLEVFVAEGPGPVHVRLVHEYESHLRSARPTAEA